MVTTHDSTNDRAIIVESEHGVPYGSYGIEYYQMRHGRLERMRSGDSGVSAAYVEREATRVSEHEVMVATCQSQPGGLTAYGSERMRALFDAPVDDDDDDYMDDAEREMHESWGD